MDTAKKRFPFFNRTTLGIAGIFAVLFLALALLWHGNVNSMQASLLLMAQA